jgi:hypothetical protein
MELIGREAQLADGLWHTLPLGKGWEDTDAAGIELGMLALRKGEFVLALFSGEAPLGQVFAIGLTMSVHEIGGVRARLPRDAEVSDAGPDRFEFRDPYQIIWQLSSESDFRTAGDFANRWIQLS